LSFGLDDFSSLSGEPIKVDKEKVENYFLNLILEYQQKEQQAIQQIIRKKLDTAQ